MADRGFCFSPREHHNRCGCNLDSCTFAIFPPHFGRLDPNG